MLQIIDKKVRTLIPQKHNSLKPNDFLETLQMSKIYRVFKIKLLLCSWRMIVFIF